MRPPTPAPAVGWATHVLSRPVTAYWLIAAVTILDWITPSGIQMGLLVCLPVVLLALQDRTAPIVAGTVLALAGRTAEIAASTPDLPRVIWFPNRVLTIAAIVASAFLSRVLQRHRARAQLALTRAVSARDTNRLLLSLLAHDLRTPLVAATQALEYVERAAAEGRAMDAGLLTATRLRLRRNLRVIETVLHVARRDIIHYTPASAVSGEEPLARELILSEVALFSGEAETQGKRIAVSVDALPPGSLAANGAVLRQALAILLDNALRYARPGTISVEAHGWEDRLAIRVRDNGPGLSLARSSTTHHGSGLGLELCRALLAHENGTLELESDSEQGTCFRLSLPLLRARQTPPAAAAASAAARAQAERAVAAPV